MTVLHMLPFVLSVASCQGQSKQVLFASGDRLQLLQEQYTGRGCILNAFAIAGCKQSLLSCFTCDTDVACTSVRS